MSKIPLAYTLFSGHGVDVNRQFEYFGENIVPFYV